MVSLGVVYRVGSRHEGPGQTGATHFLEHLMFKGTRRFNRSEGTSATRLLQRQGAAYNATTWLDRTCYFETLPSEALRLAAEIEADRMRNSLIRPEDVADERGVILNELDRGENQAFELLLKSLFSHAFTEHPYRHPTIGWREDVEKLSEADLRHYYDTFYHPRNATVILAGDLGEKDALHLVERYFGQMPPGPDVPIPSFPGETQTGERRFELRRAGELVHMALAWHIPPGLHKDMAPLIVLGQILSDGVTSRLHQALVETKLCLGLHAYPLELFDPGLFQILVTLAPGVDPDQVEGIVSEQVEQLQEKGPNLEELQRARIQTRTDLAFQKESPGRLVSALIESVAMGDWKHFSGEMERIAAVTAADVSGVAARYLRPEGLSIGTFIPEGGSE